MKKDWTHGRARSGGLVHVVDGEQLAWAAGLFDGEGYIGCVERKLRGGRPNPMIQMVVVQWHDRDVIDRFRESVGGLGHITQCVRARGEIEYRWKTGSFEHVQAVVVMLWPWLSRPKREQAARTLESFHGLRAIMGVRAWRRRVL